MIKGFSTTIFIIIILQLPLILIYQYFESYSNDETKIVDLTSLMIPFEDMDKTSTFSCSNSTLHLQYQLEYQQLQHFRLGQIYEQPNINKSSKLYSFSSLPQLPYFYSLWKSSPLLPRMLKPCQHQVYIQLLKTFHEVCEKNQIEYMISHGTLLGSYRNHGEKISLHYTINIFRSLSFLFCY